jgi:hypothetical protein
MKPVKAASVRITTSTGSDVDRVVTGLSADRNPQAGRPLNRRRQERRVKGWRDHKQRKSLEEAHRPRSLCKMTDIGATYKPFA